MSSHAFGAGAASDVISDSHSGFGSTHPRSDSAHSKADAARPGFDGVRAAAVTPLGRTLIIANPAARSGAGKECAQRLERFLENRSHKEASFELVFTERAGHAVVLAQAAEAYDSVFALGGDGVVHEVANGLMHIEADRRPALGVLPVGSGNDFARTLGISDFAGADMDKLLTCERVAYDVGRITYEPLDQGAPHPMRTEYFVETLSFGIDAAVALGTVQLRKKVPFTGAPLYLLSGMDVLLRTFQPYRVRAAFDDGAPCELQAFIMAIQLGPTYGSGFLICPEASPTDGRFDICYACGHTNRLHAFGLLLRAKTGSHVSSPLIHTTAAQSVNLEFFQDDVPIQADGEQICTRRLKADLLPQALTVLKPLC